MSPPVVVSSLSHVHLFVTPWTVAHQAPLSMGFSRHEYWGGLPFPSSGALPNPGTESASHGFPTLAGLFFITSATWEAPGDPKFQVKTCPIPMLSELTTVRSREGN